ncbi:UvrD-helicase domain-containing protein [Fusibacter sp. JL298sf-3]|jgi:DNA helicase-2/ATP-dependent DNA helicase PcrA
MSEDKLIIAAAGSGKTTYIVNKAVELKGKKVLITTYTTANEKEIRDKFIDVNGCIPSNVVIQTWFSLLLEHGVKPFQNYITNKRINGLLLVNQRSGLKFKGKFPSYYPETEVDKHYFSPDYNIYSDKISKFIIKCNEKCSNQIFRRLEKIFDDIFIDEIQDLAGYDLELIKLLLQSKIRTTLVGDPRQVTYLTHNEKKYEKYRNGKIREFLLNECKNCKPHVDELILGNSYRCNADICSYSSKLFPEYNTCGSNQSKQTEHDGVYFVKEKDVEEYIMKYNPVLLRHNRKKQVPQGSKVYNFGESKGLTFDRVLIFPTKPQLDWILGKSKKDNFKFDARCKLYVALTRARYSVGIVYNYSKITNIEYIENYRILD